MDSSKQVVWITGASSGIGEALAMAYAKSSSVLILSARNLKALDEVAGRCEKFTSKAHVVPIDLADGKSIQQAYDKVKELGLPIDVLINVGGISQRSYAWKTDFSVDRRIIEVNYFGTIQLTKLVLKDMMKRGRGHLAVVSSIVGKFGFPLRTSYSASKHALQGFFESLRTEVEPHGLHVSVIIPGRINTEISKHALHGDGKTRDIQDESLAAGMDVVKAGEQIYKGMQRKKREILVGGKELLMVHIRRLLPRLYYRMIKNIKET